jgi:hypothetical protein
MAWFKKQWKALTTFLTVVIVGTGLYYNGQHVDIIPTTGRHLLQPDFGVVATPIFQLDSGERGIDVFMVIDRATGKVKRAYADTLDTDVGLNIIKKFTQCKR